MRIEMLGVKALLKIIAAVLATWAFVAAMTALPALAGSCVRPDESLALRTAAVQQKLMVAALYCRDVGRYNRFVISYQKELQQADAELKRYFHRAGMGDAGYHAYKTRLANAFSMASIKAQDAFCEAASDTFAAAHENRGNSLAVLVRALPDSRVAEREDCPETFEARMGGGSFVRGGN